MWEKGFEKKNTRNPKKRHLKTKDGVYFTESQLIEIAHKAYVLRKNFKKAKNGSYKHLYYCSVVVLEDDQDPEIRLEFFKKKVNLVCLNSYLPSITVFHNF